MKRRILIFGFVLLLLCLAGWGAWRSFSISALQQPSRFELYAATRAKRLLVEREARGIVPRPSTPESVSMGEMQFGMRCAMCHGQDGRTPSEAGAWMYPPSSDLGSAEVQRWSDAELFWIIKNGVRFTGMPGFGKVMSDDEIWPLAHHVRQLGKKK